MSARMFLGWLHLGRRVRERAPSLPARRPVLVHILPLSLVLVVMTTASLQSETLLDDRHVQALLRISDMGVDGQTTSGVLRTQVAYNPNDHEFLVVWIGNDNVAQRTVYGQRLDASTLAEIGTNDFPISDPTTSVGDASEALALGYNPIDQTYLVAFESDQGRVPGIWGQFLAADGELLGPPVAISEASIPLRRPAGLDLALDRKEMRFLVAWNGGEVSSPAEIYGRTVSPENIVTLGEVHTMSQDIKSHPEGAGATGLAIAFNSQRGEFLLASSVEEEEASPGYVETFAQRLSSSGQPIGQPVRVSQSGENDPDGKAEEPALAYNAHQDEYLVIWRGGNPETVDREIFARRVSASGQIRGDAFRLGSLESEYNGFNASAAPSLTYNPVSRQYLITWNGYQPSGEEEVFVQRLASEEPFEIGIDDRRLSFMGPDGNHRFVARHPAVAFDPEARRYLVVWVGDHDQAPLVDDEFEVFGTFLELPTPIRPDGEPTEPQEGKRPRLAFHPESQELLAVWQASDGSEDGIYGQFHQPDATPLGTPFRINTFTPGPQSEPDVTFDAEHGEFLVVWESPEPYGDGQGIFARRIADQAPQGTEFQVNTTAIGDQISPRLASDGEEVLVLWHGHESQQNSFDIYGQRLSSGHLTGEEFRVNSITALDQAFVDLSFDEESKSFLAVWQSADTGVCLDVRGRQIIAGEALGDELLFGTVREGDQARPQATADPAGGFIVVWEKFEDSRIDIFGQRLPIIQPLGSEFRINAGQSAKQEHPQVARGNLDDFVVVWEQPGDRPQDPSQLRGQLINRDGKPLGHEFSIAEARSMVDAPVVVSTHDQRFVVAWEERPAKTHEASEATHQIRLQSFSISADLRMEQRLEVARDHLYFQIEVVNDGPGTATEVLLGEASGGLDEAPWIVVSSQGCVDDSMYPECELGDLKAGEHRSVTFKAEFVGVRKPANHRLFVTSNTPDPQVEIGNLSEVLLDQSIWSDDFEGETLDFWSKAVE